MCFFPRSSIPSKNIRTRQRTTDCKQKASKMHHMWEHNRQSHNNNKNRFTVFRKVNRQWKHSLFSVLFAFISIICWKNAHDKMCVLHNILNGTQVLRCYLLQRAWIYVILFRGDCDLVRLSFEILYFREWRMRMGSFFGPISRILSTISRIQLLLHSPLSPST